MIDTAAAGFADDAPYYVLDADRQVRPATQSEFRAMPESEALVAEDRVGTLTVTTRFVGFDLSDEDEAQPVVFQTCVVTEGDGWTCDEYASWEDAEAAHRRTVDRYRELTA